MSEVKVIRKDIPAPPIVSVAVKSKGEKVITATQYYGDIHFDLRYEREEALEGFLLDKKRFKEWANALKEFADQL